MVDIRRLDEATVERIAAGEVVERPASVVKELVENSLDADATRVEVTVERGGKDGVTVTDDGIGMTEAEVRRAVEEHTTSKIRDIDDLESGVGTLGFRGEALHAIGAVSRLTITTRPRSDRDVDSHRGTKLTVEGGEVTGVEPAGCPEGTTIEVGDLFFNVPARRKYLKQDGTEFAHVNTVVTSYALANPDIAVSLTHDGRETFATTGQGDRREAVMSVYGREVAESMVEVSMGNDGAEAGGDGGESRDEADELPEGPLDGVSGLVSHPETTRSTREYLSTYVNGRYVTAGAVRDAVVSAYGHQLAPDRYPFAVLFLDVPAGDVDVNVHPRKLEVRFADEEGVREQIETAVESALLDEGLLRSGAPRGKSAPEQAEIAPERGERGDDADSEPAPNATGAPAGPDDSPTTPQSPPDGDSSTDPDADGDRTDADEAVDSTAASTTGPTFSSDPSAPSPRSTPSGTDPSTESGGGSDGPARGAAGAAAADDGDTVAESADDGTTSEPVADSGSTPDSPDHGATPDSLGDGASPGSTAAGEEDDRARKFAGGHDQARLGDGESVADADEASAFDSLPSMRVLGQLHGTYVLAETDEGLVMVDQHAADERINYERLRERFAGETTTQALAQPVELSLTAREAELFETYGEALSTLGFRAERVGDRTVEVRTVPSLVADTADPDLLRDALAAFVDGEGSAAETVEAAADELLSDLACYPSITGNTSLTEGSVTDLLERLDDCENPWACPHGRPVVVEFDRDEIEARFERDYPGHGGRRD